MGGGVTGAVTNWSTVNVLLGRNYGSDYCAFCCATRAFKDSVFGGSSSSVVVYVF